MSKPGVRPCYPLDPIRMAEACRRIARDLRAEHALGWEPISLASDPRAGRPTSRVTRDEAAERIEAQAARWDDEAAGRAWNRVDRERIGMWPP